MSGSPGSAVCLSLSGSEARPLSAQKKQDNDGGTAIPPLKTKTDCGLPDHGDMSGARILLR